MTGILEIIQKIEALLIKNHISMGYGGTRMDDELPFSKEDWLTTSTVI